MKARKTVAECGAVLVEAAFTTILLLLMITGIFHFSTVFSASLNIRNASAVGARAAILQGYTDYTDNTQNSALVAEVQSALTPPLTPANLSVVWDEVTVTVGGTPIVYQRVQTSYPLSLGFLHLVPGLPNSMTLTAETRMR